LAAHLENHVDIDWLLAVAGVHRKRSETTQATTKTSAQAPA
jgi:hypothetical protein